MVASAEFNRESVLEVVRRNLVTHFPHYNSSQDINARMLVDGRTWISYGRNLHVDASSVANFDLSLENPNICYLSWITLRPDLRGKGNGFGLYRAIEGIAIDLGCNVVRQTPDTPKRRDYLKKRLGYVDIETGEVEKAVV